ncbi:hypothetical protein PM082_011443 [Marasmius tenuissimus]|nr:hypothetical protein PM082_011443 [Marasmius tenuissimus]
MNFSVRDVPIRLKAPLPVQPSLNAFAPLGEPLGDRTRAGILWLLAPLRFPSSILPFFNASFLPGAKRLALYRIPLFVTCYWVHPLYGVEHCSIEVATCTGYARVSFG